MDRVWLSSRSFILLLICGLSSTTASAKSELITFADMARGITITREQCAAMTSAVWIEVMKRGYCVRYYFSNEGGDDPNPVVFLSGDRLGTLQLSTGAWASKPPAGGVMTDSLARYAEQLSRQNQRPAIYLARIGMDGSSGDHRIRHTVLELHATNAALDAIKQRYGFKTFHLISQSGGGLLAVGLMSLRDDLGCVAVGAGALHQSFQRRPGGPELQRFNPANLIPAMLGKNPAVRIMILTDPADKTVAANIQTAFVRDLRKAGKSVEQYLVKTTETMHHDVVPYARLATTNCIQGKSADVIAQNIRALVEQRLGISQPKPGAEATAMPAATTRPRGKPSARDASPIPEPAPPKPAASTLPADSPSAAAARARD